MRYVGKNPGQDHISENDIDAFKNIGKLKSTTDQKDDLHIYKINSRGINGNHHLYSRHQKKPAN